MRKLLLSSVALLPFLMASAPAQATTVATIDGNYDGTSYDTPALIFHNTSGGTFINAQIVLTGYSVNDPSNPGTAQNAGTVQTVTLPDMGAGDTVVWWNHGAIGGIGTHSGTTIAGDLFSWDYDDSWGNTPSGYTNSACTLGQSLCSKVGNFSVTFTAKISGGAFDGSPVFSVFSPDSNDTGGFLGWEGLDLFGVSESGFDQHSGSNSTVNGTLAHIDIGTPPSTTPLPGALPLFASGLSALGLLGWRRKRKKTTATAAV